MTEQKPNNPWPYIALLMLAAWMFWPSLKGCSPGLEIGLPWPIGKITLKPVTPPKPVEPPKTRCLVFGADWCGHCKTLHRTIRWQVVPKGWKLGANHTDDIEEINANSSDRRVKKFKPSKLPTLVIVDQSENEVSRKTGALSAQELITWIQSTR
jgi:thiol-disulfide isomerase/thioredoxin